MTAPRYPFIADDLRRKIQDGTYTRELPSMGDIAMQYAVDRTVVVRAMKILQAEGVVDVVWGSGVFVAGSTDTRPLTERITELMHNDHMRIGAPFPTEAVLTTELGVSRTKLRPALARLEARGLIGTDSTRGRIVLALPDKEDT